MQTYVVITKSQDTLDAFVFDSEDKAREFMFEDVVYQLENLDYDAEPTFESIETVIFSNMGAYAKVEENEIFFGHNNEFFWTIKEKELR